MWKRTRSIANMILAFDRTNSAKQFVELVLFQFIWDVANKDRLDEGTLHEFDTEHHTV